MTAPFHFQWVPSDKSTPSDATAAAARAVVRQRRRAVGMSRARIPPAAATATGNESWKNAPFARGRGKSVSERLVPSESR